MDEEPFKKHMDFLWNKVHEDLDTSLQGPEREGSEISSAFDQAQHDIYGDTLKMVQKRFRKEKTYWENLVATKDESISHLTKELEESKKKQDTIKEKLRELQDERSAMVRESFSALDLQKRSMNSRIEDLEINLERSRKETLDAQLDLKEARKLQEKTRKEWDDKERDWLEQKHKREMEIEKMKQDLYERRQKELEDDKILDETITNLKKESSDNKTQFDEEKIRLQGLLTERDSQIEKTRLEISQLSRQLEHIQEETRLGIIERDNQDFKREEDRKRLHEKISNRELRISELQESLEKLIQEKESRDVLIQQKEKELENQYEQLTKRRENWVESIRDQTGQQLNISFKIVDLLNRFGKGPAPDSRLGPQPPPPVPQMKSSGPLSAMPGAGVPPVIPPREKENQSSELHPILGRLTNELVRVQKFSKKNAWFLLCVTGLFLMVSGFLDFGLESQGRKSVKAQKFLRQSNEQFTRGNIKRSLQSLEQAYQLDSDNAIIRNSYTLVLGEMSNMEYRGGQL